MSSKQDIGSILKTSLEGYSAAPNDLWPAIEAKLKRRKRIRFLLILLLLLGVATTGIVLMQDKDQTPEDSTQVIPLKTTIENEKNIAPEIDSIHLKTQELEKKDTYSESEPNDLTQNIQNKQSKRGSQNNTDLTPNSITLKDESSEDIKSINTKVVASKESIETERKPRFNQLMAVEVQSLDSLQLCIDSITLHRGNLNEEMIQDSTNTETFWGIFPYASLDRYDAFNRGTSRNLTFNSGISIAFYGTQGLSLRTGYKNLELQYNFEDISGRKQQKIRYVEIPMEARYFFSRKKFKPSFIVGGSYLFLKEATITDFNTNLIQSNENIYRQQMFSVNAGLGLHYDLNSRWRINLESVFKYHTFPFRRSQGFSPFNISTSFGIEYRLNLK